MSRKKAAVEAIKAKKAQERAEARAETQAKARTAKNKGRTASTSSASNLPPSAPHAAPTSTGFVAAKRLEDATPEELERLRLTPDGRMFRREALSSKVRPPKAESPSRTESEESAENARTAATPTPAPLDPADRTGRPHTPFKTRLYDQYARNSAARATLLDRFAEMERERKEREEQKEKEDDEDAARAASRQTETDEHEPPQPSDTEDAMTKTNRTASESTEANKDDETLDPRPEVHDGEVDLDDFDYNPEGLARMISDGYSDEEEEEEEEEDDESDCASEDDEENKEDKVEGKAEDKDEDVDPAAGVAGAAGVVASAASTASDSKAESKTEPKPAAKTAMKATAQAPKAQKAQKSQKAQTTPKAAPSKETAKTSAKAESPKTAAKNATAKPQAKKAARQSKAQAKPQSRQPKPAASAPKTTEPNTPKASKASNTEAKAPEIEPAAPVVTEARVPADVVEAALEPDAVPDMDSAPDSALLEEEPASVALPEAPATARAAESDASSKPEKPAKKLRDKTGRRAHGYADALRHAADVKAAAEARVEVSLGRTFDEIHDAADEDDEDDDEETEAEIETMTPALRFSTANATLEADEPAPMLAAHGRRGAQGARSSRDGMLPEVERIDGRRATLPRNRTGKALPRITPLYADDPAPVDVGRAYLYAVDERARALMDEDADRLMEEGFRDRYVVRTEWDGPSPVENCLRLEAETPAILDAEAARRCARTEEEQENEKADRDADGTIEGNTREPRKRVRFGRFPFALLPGKRRARGAETMNATTATNAAKATNAETTSDKIEGHKARDVTEAADVAKARPAPEKDAVAEATEGNTTAGSVPAAEARSCSLESSADEAPAAHGARTGKSSNASDASDVSNAAQGSFSVAASKAPLSRPSKTTVVLGLTALVASGLAVALAFTHPAVEAGVQKATEILKSRVPAVLGGGTAPDRLHPAILVVDRGAVEERAALARLAATRPGAQAARDAHEANAFASIDREAIDRAIEATAAENRAIVLDRRLVLAAAPEFALEKTTTSETSPVMRLDATPEVLRRLGLDKTDPAALERAVMEHWFPKTKEARGAENELEAATASESAGAAAPAAPAAPEKTLRDLAALLLPEGAEPAATDSAAGFLPVKRVRK
ncbi:hypothetical protein [Sutterella megalosphaeroides]|uniref:Uncharacterized protein n=1 Tax=Sutterella megalosphaeroides TaxID=2494234 RepID=A0A2Z6IC47_9BURK|nr:hypothetical protein [Sutterella megalosphaeroides]BBF23480.1 hypothetical protein SUTMEG_13710 [Sutterella megalosphaeroides]